MASQELKQIWEALKRVSDKKDGYKKLNSKNQEQDTAASNSFAGTIDVQRRHLEEVSEMIYKFAASSFLTSKWEIIHWKIKL